MPRDLNQAKTNQQKKFTKQINTKSLPINKVPKGMNTKLTNVGNQIKVKRDPTKQQTFPINALRPEWYDDYKAGIIKPSDLTDKQKNELKKWMFDPRSLMEQMYEAHHINDNQFFKAGDQIPGTPSYEQFYNDYKASCEEDGEEFDEDWVQTEYNLRFKQAIPETFENMYRAMCGQDELIRLTTDQAVPCFIYAMKKAGANKYILEQMKYHCNTRFTNFKKIAKMAEALKICIRLDSVDKSHDDHQSKKGIHKFKTQYVGIPKEQCKYCEPLTAQSIFEREANENGFDSNPDRDYFELGLLYDAQSGNAHYIANAIENISPYFEKHFDEIKAYATKNNIPLGSLAQVNCKVNGKYYCDKSKKHTMRALEHLTMLKDGGHFRRLTMEEMLTMPKWDGNLDF